MNQLEGETANYSSQLFEDLVKKLDADDDAQLWQLTIDTIVEDSLQ